MEYVNDCGHPVKSYIGTFCGLSRKEVYDLYIYRDGGGWSVCLRYGNGLSEYASPGEVVSTLPRCEKVYGRSIFVAIRDWMVNRL